MKKLLCIVGTRPQILKHSVFVAGAIRAKFDVRTVWTGQHWDYKLYGAFLKELDIPKPEYALRVEKGGFGKRLGVMIEGIGRAIGDYKPDYIVVYGDCDTTLAGAMCGRRMGVPVVHIEAGLRSGDMGMSEEVNRIIVDEISDILFATSADAASNLCVEGVRGKVHVVGDIVKDLIGLFIDKSREVAAIEKLGVVEQCYYFATIHRAENTVSKSRLGEILRALGALDMPVILPLHPRTAKKAKEWGLEKALRGGSLRVIQPVGYLESIRLQESAKKVITDSGGIQKEAFILGVPCVTLRDTTEYPETTYGNWNILCPDMADLKACVAAAPNRAHYQGMFGDGAAALKMYEVLK